MRGHLLIHNPTVIDQKEIDSALKNNKDVLIQFSEKLYSNEILSEINLMCSIFDANLTVRFYSIGEKFDCRAIEKIPMVKSLTVGNCPAVDHLEVITSLQHLEKLDISIYEMTETEILNADNLKALKSLSVGSTKIKGFNLEYLRSYSQLKNLVIEDQTKNIGAIADCKNLNRLFLSRISKVPLDFVNELNNLKSLCLLLGSRPNIHEIKNNNIESLSICWVRGFNDFSNSENFGHLQRLSIEDQAQLSRLHFGQPSPELELLRVSNCKNLTALTGLENLSNLQTMKINKTDVNFEDFIAQPLPEQLKVVDFYTGKRKRDREIKGILEKRGYKIDPA